MKRYARIQSLLAIGARPIAPVPELVDTTNDAVSMFGKSYRVIVMHTVMDDVLWVKGEPIHKLPSWVKKAEPWEKRQARFITSLVIAGGFEKPEHALSSHDASMIMRISRQRRIMEARMTKQEATNA